MLRSTFARACAVYLLAVLLVACGGGGGGGGGSGGGGSGSGGDSAAPAPTTLAVSVPVLALAVSGRERVVTVTNRGSVDAVALQYRATPALPIGTTLSSDCTVLLPGGSCRITVTPGAVPTAREGAAPAPVVLSVAGTNSNTVTTDLHVLAHGSVHQAGHVFALDDTTPNTGSVGGKALAMSDASPGVMWSSSPGVGDDGVENSADDAVAHLVPGIDDASVPQAGGGCLGRSDGACNSGVITSFYAPLNPLYYAAGTCTLEKDGHADWYLPAICEISTGGRPHCTDPDNVQSRLGRLLGELLPRVAYWTSTTVVDNPDGTAWALGTSAGVYPAGKMDFLRVRCVRALTP